MYCLSIYFCIIYRMFAVKTSHSSTGILFLVRAIFEEVVVEVLLRILNGGLLRGLDLLFHRNASGHELSSILKEKEEDLLAINSYTNKKKWFISFTSCLQVFWCIELYSNGWLANPVIHIIHAVQSLIPSVSLYVTWSTLYTFHMYLT